MGQEHEAHPPPHVTLTTGDEVGQGAETTLLMVASKGPVGEGQGWAGTRPVFTVPVTSSRLLS